MQKHKEWLMIAEQDLALAKFVLNDEDESIITPAIFHTQQCAEKALKAYLVYKKQTIKRTHDLMRLVKLCMHFDKGFELLFDKAEELNPYLTDSRYPEDCFETPDVTSFKIAIQYAEAVLNFVKERILD